MDNVMTKEIAASQKRWRYLVVGSLGMLFVGVLYAWSILNVPFQEELGWGAEPLALNYTVTMSFFCLGSLASGMLLKRITARLLLSLSGLLICMGFFLVSSLDSGSIVSLYLSYGVIAGLGIGIAYNALISVTGAWFPDKGGTCSGTLMMCFGLSAMVLGQAASRLFALPDIGWRRTFCLLGAAILAVLLVCALVLRKPGPDDQLPTPALRKEAEQEGERREYRAAEVVRRPTFWMFYLYGTLGSSVGSVTISFARELALSLGAGVALATVLVGVLSVFNGVGRVCCGVVFDMVGRKRTMFLVSVLTAVAPAVMLAALMTETLSLGVVAFCLIGISYSCYPTLSVAFLSSFYGQRDFPINYGVSNTKMLLSSFAATLASVLLTASGSYIAPFLMLLGFAITAFLLNFLIRKP